MKKIIIIFVALFASAVSAEPQLGKPLECANITCGKQMGCDKKPRSAKRTVDPRVDVAKRASWNLLQDHLITRKPAQLVAIKLIEQSDDYFLTQALVDADGENHVRVRQSFCLVLEVTPIPPEELQPNMIPFVVSYIENNNDVKNQFIQQCDNPPSTHDLNKIKLLNEWPGIRDQLSLEEQRSLSMGAEHPDNIK